MVRKLIRKCFKYFLNPPPPSLTCTLKNFRWCRSGGWAKGQACAGPGARTPIGIDFIGALFLKKLAKIETPSPGLLLARFLRFIGCIVHFSMTWAFLLCLFFNITCQYFLVFLLCWWFYFRLSLVQLSPSSAPACLLFDFQNSYPW